MIFEIRIICFKKLVLLDVDCNIFESFNGVLLIGKSIGVNSVKRFDFEVVSDPLHCSEVELLQ